MIAFGNAGWLVSGMLMFSDFIVVFLLLTLWYNFALEKKHSTGFYIIVYIVIPVAFGCFDYYVLSPFVSILLKY